MNRPQSNAVIDSSKVRHNLRSEETIDSDRKNILPKTPGRNMCETEA